MNIHLLCKRYYTNKDLLNDRFGRLYHLPVQLARLGAEVSVTAIDNGIQSSFRGSLEHSSSAPCAGRSSIISLPSTNSSNSFAILMASRASAGGGSGSSEG